MRLTLKVECYAGYKADERPLRFTFAPPSGRTYQVKAVIDQWYGPGYQCFKVLADDNNHYILRHQAEGDLWTLDSFRENRNEFVP